MIDESRCEDFLAHGNKITDRQSWPVKKLLFKKTDIEESESYKLFWDYIQRIKLVYLTA
jgi:hypothetical protein